MTASDPTQATPHGRTALVTARVAEGTTGEVTVAIRGGTEAFMAYPAFPGETFEVGSTVLVMDYVPPRTVRVVAAER
jgi:hypothetical protein